MACSRVNFTFTFTCFLNSKFKCYLVLYSGPRVEIISGERYVELARLCKESGLTRMLSNPTFYYRNFTFYTLFLFTRPVKIFTCMSVANKMLTVFSIIRNYRRNDFFMFEFPCIIS